MSAPRLTPGSSRCQCPTCKLMFKSASAFDEHRVGKHGVNRRCLTEAEMRAIGLEPNDADCWRMPGLPVELLREGK